MKARLTISQRCMRVVWFLKSIGLEQRQQATLAICLLWVALALPNVSTRSFIW